LTKPWGAKFSQTILKIFCACGGFQKAIALNPEYAEAHNNLGNVFMELGRIDDALDSYRKSLAINPDYVMALSNLGNAFQKLGRLDDAIASCQKALAIDPNFADAHDYLGLTLLKKGEHKAGLEHQRKSYGVVEFRYGSDSGFSISQ